ncbi:hypothetical protein KIPB_005526 [Kipferlia bialata]|uniref:Uncharacterized protein n=1 Tax=Kipferlia bialata TaxID=797122 RepID=A0A9K3GIZ4_9EUKA|nr:hypothetical protein KIPB_005526 [Kipferlia bialata]|eukprot:g5526.t1
MERTGMPGATGFMKVTPLVDPDDADAVAEFWGGKVYPLPIGASVWWDIDTDRLRMEVMQDGWIPLDLSAKLPSEGDSVVSTLVFEDFWLYGMGFVDSMSHKYTDAWLRVANANLDVSDVEFDKPSSV